jgi:predicted aspartyl protease
MIKFIKIIILSLLLIQCSSDKKVKLQDYGNVLYIDVTFNDVIKLPCILDTGASHVSMPMSVVKLLIRTGTVTRFDVLPDETYVLADGTLVTCKKFMLRSLTVGEQTVKDIEVSVSPGNNASLLLGLNAIKKLGISNFDFKNHTITLK